MDPSKRFSVYSELTTQYLDSFPIENVTHYTPLASALEAIANNSTSLPPLPEPLKRHVECIQQLSRSETFKEILRQNIFKKVEQIKAHHELPLAISKEIIQNRPSIFKKLLLMNLYDLDVKQIESLSQKEQELAILYSEEVHDLINAGIPFNKIIKLSDYHFATFVNSNSLKVADLVAAGISLDFLKTFDHARLDYILFNHLQLIELATLGFPFQGICGCNHETLIKIFRNVEFFKELKHIYSSLDFFNRISMDRLNLILWLKRPLLSLLNQKTLNIETVINDKKEPIAAKLTQEALRLSKFDHSKIESYELYIRGSFYATSDAVEALTQAGAGFTLDQLAKLKPDILALFLWQYKIALLLLSQGWSHDSILSFASKRTKEFSLLFAANPEYLNFLFDHTSFQFNCDKLIAVLRQEQALRKFHAEGVNLNELCAIEDIKKFHFICFHKDVMLKILKLNVKLLEISSLEEDQLLLIPSSLVTIHRLLREGKSFYAAMQVISKNN